jgi:hypothetical protein
MHTVLYVASIGMFVYILLEEIIGGIVDGMPGRGCLGGDAWRFVLSMSLMILTVFRVTLSRHV